MSEETNKPKEYSEKELNEMRDKMTAFYKKETKHLQPQATYYRLLAEIEESKVRKFAAMSQGAQLFAQAQAAEEEALAAKEAEKKNKSSKPSTDV